LSQPEPRPRRLPRLLAAPLEGLAVFLGFLVLAVLITAPLGFDLGGSFLAGKFMWSHAWAMEMLGDFLRGGDSFSLQIMELPPDQRAPWMAGWPGPYALHTELLGWPEGGTIVFLAWFHIVLGTLLRDLLPTVGAFNAALLLTLALAPAAAWLLARRLGAGRVGALMAGLIYGFNPYILGVLGNGQVAKINHAWPALVALLAWELCRHRRAWAVPALWVVATICLLTSPYYYVFAALLGVGIATWGLVVQPGWRQRGLVAVLLGVTGAGMLALHLPVFEHLGTREGGLLSPSTIGSDTSVYELSASLGTLLLPRQLSYTGGVLIPGETHVAYLGLATLLLAALATWARRDRAVLALWAVAVAFAVLAMGRSLVLPGGAELPMPLGLLAGALPPLRALIFVYRGVVVACLALGLVVALGWGPLAARLGRRRWLLWGAPVLILLDLLLVSPAPFPLPVERLELPQIYQELAQDPRLFGIVEFPCDLEGMEVHGAAYAESLTDLNQRQIFWQAFHGKGLGMVDKGNNHRALFQQPLLRDLVRVAAGEAPSEDAGLAESLRWLHQARFELLVVHEHALPPATAAEVRAWLGQRLGMPKRYDSDGIAVYDLVSVAAPTPGAGLATAPSDEQRAFARAVAALQGYLRGGDAALLEEASALLEPGIDNGSPTDRHRSVLLGAAARVLRGEPHRLDSADQRLALEYLLPSPDHTERLAAALRYAAGSKDESVVYRQLLGGKFCAQQACPTRNDDLDHILSSAGQRLRPGMVVADIGSGVGALSVAMAREIGPDGVVWAVDIDPGVIAFMEHALPRLPEGALVRPLLSVPGDISLAPGSVDLAVANGVEFLPMEYTPHGAGGQWVDPFLASLARSLAPGGVLVIRSDHERAWMVNRVSATGLELVQRAEPPRDVSAENSWVYTFRNQ
jgi:hypothetical protein